MLDLNGKRVLLGGATGMAGAAIAARLLAEFPKIAIIAPHRGSEGAFSKDARIDYVIGDLRDRAVGARLGAGCHAAVMAAATVGGAQAARDAPWLQVTDNVVADAQTLHALHDAQVKRLVYVSTASVYQPFEGAIAENGLRLDQDPPTAHFGVAWAKRYAETLCRFWHEKAGLAAVILRPSNIFGPYARFDPAVSNFVPALVRRAVAREEPFSVWGHAEVRRDILPVADFADAVVRALTRDDIAFDVFNIGSGRATTVAEVAAWALDQAGHRPKTLRYEGAKPTTLDSRQIDISKAAKLLGWRPSTPVEAAVRGLVDWWKANQTSWTR